jgi:hypothetical protein
MTDYPAPPYQTPPAKPSSNLALASLILGILGWTVIPGIGSIAAIVTGHLAKSEIKNSMGALGGDDMATAGLVLGYASIALGLSKGAKNGREYGYSCGSAGQEKQQNAHHCPGRAGGSVLLLRGSARGALFWL